MTGPCEVRSQAPSGAIHVLGTSLVGTEGLEPSRQKAHDPKSCLSTSSSTSPGTGPPSPASGYQIVDVPLAGFAAPTVVQSPDLHGGRRGGIGRRRGLKIPWPLGRVG